MIGVQSVFSGTSLLLVLDGWGHRTETDYNAIALAETPVWDDCWKHAPNTLLTCSGEAVGLPDQQMGSSEVGHMNLGAGRIVYQDFTRISKAIDQGQLAGNEVLSSLFSDLVETGATLHLLGLLSPGGVHSHQDHIYQFARLAVQKGVRQIHLHAFLDGRDTPPRSAEASIVEAEAWCRELSGASTQVVIASLCGRYFSMDRDKNWDRIQLAYDLLVHGKATRVAGRAQEGLAAAYAAGENDEFVKPTIIKGAFPGGVERGVKNGDAVVFMNFRSDRARQLSQALVAPEFLGFKRGQMKSLSGFATLTQYADDLPAQVIFPQRQLTNTLGEYISNLDMAQLRIAETEKYAHVTFFFSGGREALWPKEERVLIPSPSVDTYDLKPEMSAHRVTDAVVKAIADQAYDLIVCNFANSDMVGHTGVLPATVKAIETLDQCIGRIIKALESQPAVGQCLITADHGNAEQMFDPHKNQPHTAHTTSKVPLVYIGPQQVKLNSGGRLADVAPTLLALMGIPQPVEMTGCSLLL